MVTLELRDKGGMYTEQIKYIFVTQRSFCWKYLYI